MNILDLELRELENYIKNAGQPVFRASQIFGWIAKGITEPEKIPRNQPRIPVITGSSALRQAWE